MRIQGVALEHHGDITILRFHIVYYFPVDNQLAGADVLQAGHHPQRGGFAAAGRPYKDDKFFILNIQIKVFHCLVSIGISLAYIF